MSRQQQQEFVGHPLPLSHRETEVVKMASLGLSNGEIAQRLSVTDYAVKFHLASVYRKLGVANRTQAAIAYLNLRPKD
jgi:ATP/maltotriose-dependent transcriptional regulator MalT